MLNIAYVPLWKPSAFLLISEYDIFAALNFFSLFCTKLNSWNAPYHALCALYPECACPQLINQGNGLVHECNKPLPDKNVGSTDTWHYAIQTKVDYIRNTIFIGLWFDRFLLNIIGSQRICGNNSLLYKTNS